MGARDSNKLMVTTPSDREIVMTRVFDAPRDLVFEAHSSCEHMSNWWGPRKYEFVELRDRLPPRWGVADRAPASGRRDPRVPRRVPGDRAAGAPGVDVRVGGGTRADRARDHHVRGARRARPRITTRSICTTVEERDAILESGMVTGAAETYDRLEEYLQAHDRRVTS